MKHAPTSIESRERDRVAPDERTLGARAIDATQRAHHRPHSARHLPEREAAAQRDPEDPLPGEHLVDCVREHREHPRGHIGPDLGGEVVVPHAGQMQQPGDSQDEEHEWDDRGQNLKRDRTRVRQQVVLLEAIEDRVASPRAPERSAANARRSAARRPRMGAPRRSVASSTRVAATTDGARPISASWPECPRSQTGSSCQGAVDRLARGRLWWRSGRLSSAMSQLSTSVVASKAGTSDGKR